MCTYNHLYLFANYVGAFCAFIIIFSQDIKIGGSISSSLATVLKDIFQLSLIVDYKQTTNSNEEEKKQIKNQKGNLEQFYVNYDTQKGTLSGCGKTKEDNITEVSSIESGNCKSDEQILESLVL